jgi:hypothetical protein
MNGYAKRHRKAVDVDGDTPDMSTKTPVIEMNSEPMMTAVRGSIPRRARGSSFTEVAEGLTAILSILRGRKHPHNQPSQRSIMHGYLRVER